MPAGEVEMGDDGRGSDGVFWQSARCWAGRGDWEGDLEGCGCWMVVEDEKDSRDGGRRFPDGYLEQDARGFLDVIHLL